MGVSSVLGAPFFDLYGRVFKIAIEIGLKNARGSWFIFMFFRVLTV